MNNSEEDDAQCPVGEDDCPRLDELAQLRTEASELAGLVHRDPLTGLFNFRHFELVVEQELERTGRSGQPTGLIMLDLDRFKSINDRWGHESGNLVLKRCAALMRDLLRKVDLPCRYGGEEFALILPGTPLPRAVSAAERLRRAIAELELAVDGTRIPVTASFGVEAAMKHEALSPKVLVERADTWLYRAKQQGRDRVCHPEFDTRRPPGQVGPEEKAELFKL